MLFLGKPQITLFHINPTKWTFVYRDERTKAEKISRSEEIQNKEGGIWGVADSTTPLDGTIADLALHLVEGLENYVMDGDYCPPDVAPHSSKAVWVERCHLDVWDDGGSSHYLHFYRHSYGFDLLDSEDNTLPDDLPVREWFSYRRAA